MQKQLSKGMNRGRAKRYLNERWSNHDPIRLDIVIRKR